jgi:hypothetical protein
MPERNERNPGPLEIAERAIVLQVLRDDHDERWSLAELQAEIGVEPTLLSSAVKHLEQQGALVSLDACVLASRCARHLDGLWLIGV